MTEKVDEWKVIRCDICYVQEADVVYKDDENVPYFVCWPCAKADSTQAELLCRAKKARKEREW